MWSWREMSLGPLPLLTRAAAFGGPRTSLRFSNSLEGLTVLRKALTLMVTVYYMGRIQIKNGQGRGTGAECRREPNAVFQLSSPLEIRTPDFLGDSAHAVLPTRAAHLSLVSEVLTGAQSRRPGWLPPWLSSWEVRQIPHDLNPRPKSCC